MGDVALAPLVVLSALAIVVALLVPAWVGYLAVVFIGNTVGAIGDIWMTSSLIRFRGLQADTYVNAAYATATVVLTITVKAGVGEVNLELE